MRALRDVEYFVVTDRSGRGGMPHPLVNARERLLDRTWGTPVIVRMTTLSGSGDQTVPPPRRSTTKPSRGGTRSVNGVRGGSARPRRRGRVPRVGRSGLLRLDDPDPARGAASDGRLDLGPTWSPASPASSCWPPATDSCCKRSATAARHLRASAARGDRAGPGQHRRDAQPGDPARRAARRLGDWSIWWGGNLGTASEQLVAGRVADVLPEIEAARARDDRAG